MHRQGRGKEGVKVTAHKKKNYEINRSKEGVEGVREIESQRNRERKREEEGRT